MHNLLMTLTKMGVIHIISNSNILYSGYTEGGMRTPKFMEYENVCLLKNHFIKKETMWTEDYLALFFPSDKPELHKVFRGGPTQQSILQHGM